MKIELDIPDALAAAILAQAPEPLRVLSPPEKTVKSWIHGAIVWKLAETFGSSPQAMLLLEAYRTANNLSPYMFLTPADPGSESVS